MQGDGNHMMQARFHCITIPDLITPSWISYTAENLLARLLLLFIRLLLLLSGGKTVRWIEPAVRSPPVQCSFVRGQRGVPGTCHHPKERERWFSHP